MVHGIYCLGQKYLKGKDLLIKFTDNLRCLLN